MGKWLEIDQMGWKASCIFIRQGGGDTDLFIEQDAVADRQAMVKLGYGIPGHSIVTTLDSGGLLPRAGYVGLGAYPAVTILSGEQMKRLFQLGFSIVLELKFAAQATETVDYPSGRLLAGLKAKRPRFYRGLDPDGIDGYREFKALDDVKRAADLLGQHRG